MGFEDEPSACASGVRDCFPIKETAGMWCRACQQDVPAVAASGDSSRVCCARCGEDLRRTEKAAKGTSDAPLRIAHSPSPPGMPRDDWQLEEELREAQRLVRLVASRGRNDTTDSTVAESTSARPESTAAAKAKPTSGGGLFGWTLSGLGLSGLVCGCALLVWSLASGRDELWTIGLPTALVSQVVLICGILLRRDEPASAAAGSSSDEPTATYVQVQSSAGGMHPSGLSVHFSNTPALAGSLNTDQLRREIEAVMRRQRAA